MLCLSPFQYFVLFIVIVHKRKPFRERFQAFKKRVRLLMGFRECVHLAKGFIERFL